MTPGASDGGLPLSTRPDDDDVAFYAEHGWWISPKVLSDDFIDAAVDAAERFYRARDRTLPFEDGYSNWTEDDGFDVVRNNEFVSLQSDDLRAVACQPVLGAMAARLAGSAGIRLLDDQLVYKPPSAPGAMTAVGWHADHAYWGTCSSQRLLTAWIPFQRRRRRERNARRARRQPPLARHPTCPVLQRRRPRRHRAAVRRGWTHRHPGPLPPAQGTGQLPPWLDAARQLPEHLGPGSAGAGGTSPGCRQPLSASAHTRRPTDQNVRRAALPGPAERRARFHRSGRVPHDLARPLN